MNAVAQVQLAGLRTALPVRRSARAVARPVARRALAVKVRKPRSRPDRLAPE